MPLQATSGAASYDAFGGGVAAVPQYIEDVFSTTLYTGNGSTQTITNGIDLSGEGGMVWVKRRSSPAGDHAVVDTVRGLGLSGAYTLIPNGTYDQFSTNAITAFNSNGFDIGSSSFSNSGSLNYASWTFRKQPKFFDVVTYTGDGTYGRAIPHNLGSTPGCFIIKCTSNAADWIVYHSALGVNSNLLLNDTSSAISGNNFYNGIAPTSTNIYVGSSTVGSNAYVNQSGRTYVAYLYASNAGGFGLTGTDNVISCGSFTTDAFGDPTTVNLGYEPQWVLLKSATSAASWFILDTMRGWTNSPTSKSMTLLPNTSGAEAFGTVGADNLGSPTATGFTIKGVNAADTMIYIAIRRGPMKVPTDATTVFSPNQTSGTTGTQITTGFPVDWQLLGINAGNVYNQRSSTRLTGVNTDGTSNSQYLVTSNTNAEAATASVTLNWGSTGYQVPSLNSGSPIIGWNFGRAPSYMDVVCYTGVGYPTALTVNHNLGVAPEMMIVKKRSATQSWFVYHAAMGNDQEMYLNQAASMQPTTYDWNSTTPSATTFTVNASTNNSGATYVAYLFATCAGVSKVGSYTGTGTTLQVNCGFTAGARFVLIKKTSGTGSWYVWDSARGIVSGNDPYLLLNSTAAEVTNTDYIDTYSAGFEISSTAPSEINENGGSFIFFAVA